MSRHWKSDEELCDLAKKELFTAVVGDILDKMGLYHQFLPPTIRPVKRDMMVIGRAMTVLETDCFIDVVKKTQNPLSAKPFGMLFEALDDLRQGEVYICTGASPRYALWGGVDVHPRYPPEGRRGRGGRLLPGHHGDHRACVPVFRIQRLRPGSGTQGKSRRLSGPH
jgi:hypothetical protein